MFEMTIRMRNKPDYEPVGRRRIGVAQRLPERRRLDCPNRASVALISNRRVTEKQSRRLINKSEYRNQPRLKTRIVG